MDYSSFSGWDFFFGNSFEKILLLVFFFGTLKSKGIMRFHASQSLMLTGLIELSSSLDTTCLVLFFFIKNCHALTLPFTRPDRGLISAPLIPAGFRGLRRSPAESGGLKIGRGPCKNYYSGSFSVRRNFLTPELIPECSPGFTGTECHWNPVTGVAIKFLFELII